MVKATVERKLAASIIGSKICVTAPGPVIGSLQIHLMKVSPYKSATSCQALADKTWVYIHNIIHNSAFLFSLPIK